MVAQKPDISIIFEFLTRIRLHTREAFQKLAAEEKQTLAVHALCKVMSDRNMPPFVATQARDSAARALRIAAEGMAVNSKTVVMKRRGISSKNALVGVSSSHIAAYDYSFYSSESPFESVQSGSSVYPDSEDADCINGAHGKDASMRARRNFGRNSKSKGEGGQQCTLGPLAASVVEEKCTWLMFARPQLQFEISPSWKSLLFYRCGKTCHMQSDCQEIVARSTEANSTSATRAQTLPLMQPRVCNTKRTSTPRTVDPKRLALIAKEINESIRINYL